jgi:mannose-6-phosphate isomerase-like protein (cupin superfamily)
MSNWYVKRLEQIEGEELYGATIRRCLEKHELPAVGADHVLIRKGSELKPHIHDGAESFLWVVSGSALLDIGSDSRKVTQNDFIYVPPGVAHGFRTPDEDVVLFSIQSPPIYPKDGHVDIRFPDDPPPERPR